MTRISKYKLSDRVYEKLFSLLFEVLAKGKNKILFDKILTDLFSPTERIMIAKRVVIVFLLMKNIDYRVICSVVKVSSGTVSKFRIVMDNSQGIVPALEEIVRNEKILLFLQGLFNDLFPPGQYGINWKDAWQRKFELARVKNEGI